MQLGNHLKEGDSKVTAGFYVCLEEHVKSEIGHQNSFISGEMMKLGVSVLSLKYQKAI